MTLALVASVLDVCTIVMLIPLLQKLFGDAGAFGRGSPPYLVKAVHALLDPLTAGQPDSVAIVRLVVLFLVMVFLKTLAIYLSAYLSMLVQEVLKEDRSRAICSPPRTKGRHHQAALLGRNGPVPVHHNSPC